MDTTDAAHVYTDDLSPHPNLMIGALHLAFWILFHPTSWRLHVARLDPSLRANFHLYDLTWEQWQNPELRRLVTQCCVIFPIVMNGLSAIVLAVSGIEGEDLWRGIWVGVASGITASAALGTTLSLAVGVVASLIGGTLLGIAIASAPSLSASLGSSLLIEFVSVLAVGVTAGSMPILAGERFGSWHRQIGSFMAGVLVVGAGGLVGAMVGRFGRGVHAGLAHSLGDPVTRGVIVGCVFGMSVALAAAWRSRSYRRLVVFLPAWGGVGSLVGYLCGSKIENIHYTIADAMLTTASAGTLFSLATGVAAALVVCLSLIAPYTLTERVAGLAAGVVAGVIGSGIGFVMLSVQDGVQVVFTVILLLVGMLLGLTQVFWRQVVLHPFFSAWNTLLLERDKTRQADERCWLRWHSAFWDELQTLTFHGLDDHLILLARNGSDEVWDAIEYLRTSNQRWAVQEAEIELSIYDLEDCQSIELVRNAHKHIYQLGLDTDTNILFHEFREISLSLDGCLKLSSRYKRSSLISIVKRLEEIQRALISETKRHQSHFQKVSYQWLQLIKELINKINEDMNYYKDIEQVYLAGPPITEERGFFVGRADIGLRLETLVLGRNCPALLLYGQRRMGKTSLLMNLKYMMSPEVVPLYVDLQGGTEQATNHKTFFQSLYYGIEKSAKLQRIWPFPSLDTDRLSQDPFTTFNVWLDQVEERMSSKKILLALDEFEAFDVMFKNPDINEAAVMSFLRHFIQHRPQFKVLLSGSHTLEEISHWSTYLINVRPLHVSYLKEPEARELIEKPVEEFGLQYEPNACERVLWLTRSHPYLVQLLCTEILEIKNEQDRDRRFLVNVEDVDDAVVSALTSGHLFFSHIHTEQIDEPSRRLLKLLASTQNGAGLSRDELTNHFLEQLDDTLALLVRRELIEYDRCARYHFQVELIRQWFAQYPA